MKLALGLIAMFSLLIGACNQPQQTGTTSAAPPQASDGKLTAEQIQKLLTEALAELDKKNFGRSIEITVRITKSDSGNVEAYVVESQAASMAGDAKAAIDALEQAFQNGFKDIERVTKERRFDPIRSLPEFQEMLRRRGFTSSATVGEKEVSAGNVSIKEEAGTQVIKAGDITLRVPKN